MTISKEEVRRLVDKGIDESFRNHPESWALCNRMRQVNRLSAPEPVEPKDEVRPEFGCPKCHERRADYLVIDGETDTITCSTCQNRYQIKFERRLV